MDGIQNICADYILTKKDGTVWVIKTRYGEARGQEKISIDRFENKFNAFMTYAAKHNPHLDFV